MIHDTQAKFSTEMAMALQLNFNSDNCSAACPEVMSALIA
eukprot:SAG11_NODE_29773_length_307_cov_0.995192_1_plen_39_part_10